MTTLAEERKARAIFRECLRLLHLAFKLSGAQSAIKAHVAGEEEYDFMAHLENAILALIITHQPRILDEDAIKQTKEVLAEFARD